MPAITSQAALPGERRWLSFDGPLSKRVITLAGPTVAAMISQTLINNADHILVGRITGFVNVHGTMVKESLAGQAALGPGMAMMWLVGGALSAISVGTQALVSRRYGESDRAAAGRVLANSALASLILGTICSIAFVFLAPSIFRIMVKDPAVQEVGIPFIQWRYAAVLSMAMTASYKAFFDGIGQTRVHFVVAVTMNVVNFILNIGLIFGHFGMPALGVYGSGMASCISSYVGCFMIIIWSLRKEVREIYKPYRLGNFSKTIAKEIGRLSSPSAVAVIISLIGFGVFYTVCDVLDHRAGHTAPIYLSATTNLINIFMLVFISCIAYGQATATMVGQALGADNPDLAERSAIEAAKIGVVVFSALAIFTIAFPSLIIHIWTQDQPVIDAAAPILRVLGFFEPLACIALVFMYSLYGAGASRFVMGVELTLHLGCLVPLCYILGVTLGFGLWGAWCAMIAYIVLMATVMSWKFLGGTWKHIKI
jgi:putative MATE family efflux protein